MWVCGGMGDRRDAPGALWGSDTHEVLPRPAGAAAYPTERKTELESPPPRVALGPPTGVRDHLPPCVLRASQSTRRLGTTHADIARFRCHRRQPASTRFPARRPRRHSRAASNSCWESLSTSSPDGWVGLRRPEPQTCPPSVRCGHCPDGTPRPSRGQQGRRGERSGRPWSGSGLTRGG